MGQSIVIEDHTVVGDVAMFSTDRSITGQDGVAFGSIEEARASSIFPGTLAERLFAEDPGVDHVFVASNQVVVRRPGGWDAAQLSAASDIIIELFRFYTAE